MKPPIFVWEDGDLAVFDSPEEAEAAVESPDVENEIYKVFDSEGRRLRFEIRPPPGKADQPTRSKVFGLEVISVWPVVLRQVEAVPSHADELRNILTTALEGKAVPKAERSLPLTTLVSKAEGALRGDASS